MVKRDNHLSGGFLLIILFILVTFFVSMKGDGTILSTGNNEDEIFIEVSGEVKKAGIYTFNWNPRLYDVLKRAGCEVTEAGLVNDSGNPELHSGMKIQVYREGERISINKSEMLSHHKVTLDIPISLNRESMEGLTAIPGIGPSLSRRIADERKRKGGYTDLQQLKELPGVGDKLYDKIIPYLEL